MAIDIGLHSVGFELRGTKDTQGQPHLGAGREGLVSRLLIGSAAAVSLGASVVMGYRVVKESLAAETGVVGAVVLGCFFALTVAALNLVVAVTVLRDGSVQTDELSQLHRQLRRIRLRRLALQRRGDQLRGEIDQLIITGRQVRSQTMAKLAGPIAGADQLRAIARSLHQACGWSVNFLPGESESFGLFAPGIEIDTTVLDELLAQLEAMAVPREVSIPDVTEAGGGEVSGSTDVAAELAVTNGQAPKPNGAAV